MNFIFDTRSHVQSILRLNKKSKIVGILIVSLTISSPSIFAENRNVLSQQENVEADEKLITGIVIDDSGEPVIGANITIEGTTIGTITDLDGKFSLQVSPSSVIKITYIGYKQQLIQIGNKNNLKIVIQEETANLDEVVVVGFGSQKKVNLTGSIGTIKAEESLKARPVTNVQELLAGAVPGMSVSKGSGAAGSGASINVRGTSTIGKSSGVLILIDGMPGNMYTLNPNDIESISVLKDAASASIYGSRAANGVILITTKTAKNTDKPVVEFTSTVGLQNPQFKLDFVGSEDYMRLYDQALINDGKDAYFGDQGIADLHNGKYPDNQWYKEVYRKNTLINNNYIALSGKEKAITYRLSLSNDTQQGTLPNNHYQRFIIKPDFSIQILKNLVARVNLQYTQTNIKNPNGGTDIWQIQASRISPITPIREANGLYAVGSSVGGNPIAGVEQAGYSKERHKEMLSIFDLSYSPIKDWNIKATYSNFTHDNVVKNRANTYYLYDAEGAIAKTENMVSSLRNTNSYNMRSQLQFLTDYSLKINRQHNFKFLAGYSQEYYKEESFWASRNDMPFDGIDVIDVGSSNKQNGGTAKDVAIQSLFARVNYDYMGKYLFEANVRGDGSSRFAEGNRWGIFPSFSGGWNIQKETFLLDNTPWLSELKLRASWGILGDAEKVGYYPTAQVLAYDPKIYSFNNALVGGAYNNVSINRNITWEESQLTNIGLDFGMFDQKIKLTMEYFINERRNILYAPPVPTEFGLGAPLSNMLKMKNEGVEGMIAYRDQKNDFIWGIDFNASYSKNKVLEMGASDKWVEGNSLTMLNDRYQLPYGYESDGLFQSKEEIEASAEQGAVQPGNIKFKDQNEDGIINGEDRVVLSRKIPVNYGVNLQFGYKNFDFSMNMYGQLNTLKYISGYEGWAFYLSQNVRPMHLDSWTESNPNASYPRLTLTNTANDTQYNDYWLRNADFLKIQNVQVGYVIPKKVLDKVNIKYLRLYLSGQNLATISGYDGFDPEGGWYPLSRTFSFGLNLQF